MLSKFVLSSVIAALAVAYPAQAAPQQMPRRDTIELSKVAQLRIADTAVDRFKLLPKDEDFMFDFSKSQIPVATASNFPALVGSGASFSLTSLPGCHMAFLHLHPRASELFAVTSGRVVTEMVPEAGVVTADGKQRVIRTDLSAGMLTIFPQGSFHTQVNPNCETANISAFFTAEDFGAGLVADQTFALSDDVIIRTFGESIPGEDIEKIRHAIPGTMAILVDECMAKCNKTKRHF